MARRAIRLAVTLAAVVSTPELFASQQPSLDDVIGRASAYVHAFGQQLSSIVAEETYEQFARRPPPRGEDGAATTTERRRLKSDLVLLRPANNFAWVQFRDVFEVDGAEIRDRETRLAELFLRPPASVDVVNRIRRESARYNIGAIERTMNVPVLPLTVLDSRTKARFRFRRRAGAAEAAPVSGAGEPASSHFRASTELWVVGFEERRGPTLVRTPNGRNLFSRGRLWIEPETGRVMMAEMITGSDDIQAQLTVSYRSEPLLGFFVPIEMRERYQARDGYVVEGTASYSGFRQFRRTVDEKVAPPR